MTDRDPTGLDPHDPGAKLDKGKVMAGLLFDFAEGLWSVAEVGTHGTKKYSRGGWQKVPNGEERYYDAMGRHILKEIIEGPIDADSECLHAAQIAWNALARLTLMIRRLNETPREEALCNGCDSGWGVYRNTNAERIHVNPEGEHSPCLSPTA